MFFCKDFDSLFAKEKVGEQINGLPVLITHYDVRFPRDLKIYFGWSDFRRNTTSLTFDTRRIFRQLKSGRLPH